MWRTGRIDGCIANRSALHEDNRRLTIAADRRGREAQYLLRLHTFENAFKRRGADVMAFVDNDVSVIFNQRVDIILAG